MTRRTLFAALAAPFVAKAAPPAPAVTASGFGIALLKREATAIPYDKAALLRSLAAGPDFQTKHRTARLTCTWQPKPPETA